MVKIAFHTLGCKLNFAESSHLLRKFKDNGFEEVSFNEKADVYVINTCTVTAVAEKKCKYAIRRAAKLNPNAIIAVIGCFSQINPEEIAKIKGVNLILGNEDKNMLFDKVVNMYGKYLTENNSCEKQPLRDVSENCVSDISHLKSFSPSVSSDDRTRGFLKVQDGCDYFCSYCEIPFARGRSRSCTVNQAVQYVRILEQEGKKETVLTGVNIGDFGKGTTENFFDLIKALDLQTTMQRFRISSIEPDLLSKQIIDFCASSRSFMPHFHIPLQSGSNTVLKLMNRHYTREDFADKVLYIRSVMPHAFIACDVMTGFNGESEKEFQLCVDFLNSLPIAFIHVFPYSDRPDTKADKIPGKVPVHVRKQRSDVLQQLSKKKKRDFYESNIGYTGKILWEETSKNGIMYGFSDNYLRVSRPFDDKLMNSITTEKLSDLSPESDIFIL